MDTKEIQRLLDYIAKSPLAEVSIETDGLKIAVKKKSESEAPTLIQTVSASPAPVAAVPAAPVAPVEKKEETNDKLFTIKSPMIGTFYRSPGPDKPNFIEIGDSIEPGKTVCIIEAMKLFNEIDSEISGKIVKILVENASPVEFDQPLFLVELA